MEMEQKRPAGLGIRFCAGSIDLALVAGAVILVVEVVAGFGVYIPIEITVLGVYAVYTAVGIGWKGRTLGKAALGVRVIRQDGGNVGWIRASARAILVGVFQILLGLPLLLIGARRLKRGWHDRLTGTAVICQAGLGRRRRIAFAAVMTFVGVNVAFFAFDTVRLYRMHRAWVADAEAAANRTQRVATDAVEAASVDTAQRGQMAAWLAEHGGDPATTLIDLASTHQVSLIGERHGKKAYLDLLNEVLPDLYHKAGVRTLAMECCHPDQNRKLDRLVQGRQFDRELWLALAREVGWRAWGYKGYWDALETVWRVNQARPQGSEPLRVVGISPRFDGPSRGLVEEGPWYEKLRIVRLVGFAPLVFFHDACYARCVEREAFDNGRRTVVWVGAEHGNLCPSVEKQRGNGTVRRVHRMGSLLFGRYGSVVGQAVLHSGTQEDRVAKLIEECAQQCSKTRIMFTTAESPFALLRDAAGSRYRSRPARSLADSASHYIMLMPEEELQDCDWLEGFLTRRMLGENRPYYELLAGGAIDELNDGNRRIAKGIGGI